jgi:predicted Zn finger-like uncharacterized protein
MKVRCPSCQAKYNIADDKVKGKKVKVRCKSCGTQILVDGNAPSVSSVPPDDQSTDAGSAIPSESPPMPDMPEPETSNAWTVNFSDTDERSLTTAEIADMAVQGQLPDEVFVWKEGMDDWQQVTSVPELASAIAAARKRVHATSSSPIPGKAAEKKASSETKQELGASSPPSAEPGTSAGPIVAAPGSALAKKMASAKSAAAQKKSAAAEAGKHESHDDPGAKAGGTAKKSATEPPPTAESPAAPKAATKLAAKRQTGTHDLFAAVDKAGSEIDVVMEPEGRDTAAKATGARNENSVLFSLDALKSGVIGGASSSPAAHQPAPAGPGPRKKAPAAPAKRLEDLMAVDLGPSAALGRSGGGLLLSGNDALLAAPPPPPPKPEPKPVSVAPAVGGSEMVAPPAKSRLGLFIALAVGLVALGAGGSFLLMKSSSPQGPEASASGAASAASALAMAAKSAAPAASSAPSEVAKNESPDAGAAVAAASASASATATAQPVAVAKVGGGGAGKVTPGKPSVATETKPPEKKETKPAEPASGGGSGGFNKDAAVAALSVAASQATVCKRPEGPWGSGRAVVTFASSGRVTTANVTGDPFGGTAVGGCVASVFRRAKIPPFSGDPVTVSKSFTIAP